MGVHDLAVVAFYFLHFFSGLEQKSSHGSLISIPPSKKKNKKKYIIVFLRSCEI